MLGELSAAFPDQAVSICLAGAAAAVAGVGFCRKGRRRSFWIRSAFILACAGVCFCAGFFVYKNVPEKTPAEEKVEERGEIQVRVQGRAARILPQRNGYRIILEECRLLLGDEEYQEEKIAADFAERPLCGPGQQAEIWGKASLAEKARNPGEFDFREYYRAQGVRIFLKGAVLKEARGEKDPVKDWLERFREKAAETLRGLAGEKNGGILAAVLLGDKSRLDPEARSLYQESGISHLLAVSGLHVSLAGTGIWLAVRKLCGGLRLPTFCGGVLIICYCFLTGAGVSSVRAACMYLFLLGARCLGRSYDGLNAAGAAAVMILLGEPLQLFQGGFQLSFGAILSIYVLYGPLKDWCLPEQRKLPGIVRKTAEAALLSAAVQIGTLPVLCWHFYVWPPYGMLLNLWVIPLLTGVFLTGACGCAAGLLGCPLAGQFLTGASGAVLWLYEQSCRISLKLPGAEQILGRPSAEKVILCYMGILMFLGWRKWKGREVKKKGLWKSGLGAGCLLLAEFFCFFWHPDGISRLDMLDVGQGDGMVLEACDGTVFLIDGGSTDEKNVGTECILPYLRSAGIRKLDYALVSHADDDHVNGLKELLETGYPVGCLLLPEIDGPGEKYRELEETARRAGVPAEYLSAGMSWRKGDTVISCLHPPKGLAWQEDNSYSMVLKVQTEGMSLLLTGDLDEQGERELLESGTDLSCQVLKTAHHGSRFSTSEEFLERASPQVALISAGRENSYGHPHKETLDRFLKRGIQIRRTDQEGMLRVEGGSVYGFLTDF